MEVYFTEKEKDQNLELAPDAQLDGLEAAYQPRHS